MQSGNLKPTLGVIFGGRSVEHEVSILTGHQVLDAIDRDKYDVRPVYIARDNLWFIGEGISSLDFFRRPYPPLQELTHIFPCPDPARGKLRLVEARPSRFRRRIEIELDLILPATHGTFVEDGSLQGIFEMADVPVAGSGVRASAVGMDKELTKAVLLSAGIPHLPFASINRADWRRDSAGEINKLANIPGLPLIVKPAVLGSSVAVSVVRDEDELTDALDLALKFCDRAIAEPFLEGATEVNCAVLDGDPPIPSILEQVTAEAGMLTFDEKYRGGGKKDAKGAKTVQGMAGQRRIIPAPLDDGLTDIIQQTAVKTFTAIGAGGVARVDFLIDMDGHYFVNELNNIPGSLSYYLWEYMGRSFRELIDRMVQRAYEVQALKRRTTFSFDANLLAGR